MLTASDPEAGEHMTDFAVSSVVRRDDTGRFVAVASATPCEGGNTDSRTRICGSLVEAREAELELASDLSYEINERGDRVVDIRID